MENEKNGKLSIKRAKAIKIEIKRIVDENPDLSFLETTAESHYGIDGSNWEHISEDDKQKAIIQYGSIWNACEEYAKQDEKRLNDYDRGIYDMIGIVAVATIHIPTDNGSDKSVKIQTIDSGGLWGIESDCDKKYMDDIGREQIDEVKKYLRILCVEDIDRCEITTE